jgi:hypothetical protein
MGKHSSKKKHKQKQKRSAEPLDGPKLLKYAALGKARRIRSALAVSPALVNYKDPGSGNTALHQVGTVPAPLPALVSSSFCW